MIPKEHAHLDIAAITHEGMSGKNNEDRYGVSAHIISETNPISSVFAIVADGIGGHSAGEIAAEIAVETISHAVASSDGSDPRTTLEKAIIQTGLLVNDQAKIDAAQQGMGSTCVCTWILEDRLYIASVGDSRIYLIRGETIRQLTTDHTWVQEAVEHGIIAPEQVRGHPQSHIIRRYLGSSSPVEPDFRLRLDLEESDEQALANQGAQLLPGDKLLLCSDGLTDLVEDDEILETLQQQGLDAASKHLVDLANQRGGHDNTTIVILEVPKIPEEEDEQQKKKTPSKKLYWLVGIVMSIVALIVITTLAFVAWQFTHPEATPTITPQAATPSITETSIPPTDEINTSATSSPLLTETPIQIQTTPQPALTPEG
ncbi:MAG: protein phosphatase 2C domain-containing protein [Chloroflexota bacterium]|nr:protein phosphatase 2C domain-containing protein [Chloroflexota bacterium]